MEKDIIQTLDSVIRSMTMTEKKVGNVTHYYNHLHVATVKITDGELHVGDVIHIDGHTSDFTQRIKSMQLDHEPVEVAHEGEIVGIETNEYVRENDSVYIVH
jgi:translation elongation factor EF-1alpha